MRSARVTQKPPSTRAAPAAAEAPARGAPTSTAERDAFVPAPGKKGALSGVRSFAKGAWHGAVHPFQVVQKEKMKAGVGLAGLAAASAGWQMMGLPDPTMAIVATGGLVVGYDAFQVGREYPRLPAGSDERKGVAGSVASKFGLWALTSTIAHFISPHDAHAVVEGAAHARDALSLAKTGALGAAAGLAAGADAVLFALDAADHKKHADAHDAHDDDAPPPRKRLPLQLRFRDAAT